MWALNEVEGMVQKAARGAGIPLGQAEDLGRVAAYLAGTGGNISVVTNVLQEAQSAVEVTWQAQSVTVVAGPAALVAPIIRDAFAMGSLEATVADIAHAPLVAAFLAHDGMAQKWRGCTLTPSDTSVLRPKCNAVEINPDDWDIWTSFAARTYVPQSDASRLSGAGAGLTDND